MGAGQGAKRDVRIDQNVENKFSVTGLERTPAREPG